MIHLLSTTPTSSPLQLPLTPPTWPLAPNGAEATELIRHRHNMESVPQDKTNLDQPRFTGFVGNNWRCEGLGGNKVDWFLCVFFVIKNNSSCIRFLEQDMCRLIDEHVFWKCLVV